MNFNLPRITRPCLIPSEPCDTPAHDAERARVAAVNRMDDLAIADAVDTLCAVRDLDAGNATTLRTGTRFALTGPEPVYPEQRALAAGNPRNDRRPAGTGEGELLAVLGQGEYRREIRG